ncbi:MAG TPA: methylenetetrahydrofolate reductase [Solirubrobacteraceae bacterium]|nr:methylenetetrahydrofolate reductase [Solirubrobacteraceae bacterium]
MPTLERKLDAKQFVVTAEMPVIDGGGQADVLRHLEPMRPFVDAYNATDNPSAHAHVSPLAVSIGLANAGAEPIMQLACRDRNRLALEAELMGAAMHGIENISCMTGDDVSAGNEPEARSVFDLDSLQLLQVARVLERGHYLSGRAIEPAGAGGAGGPHFFLGAVENPGAPPYEYRVRRAAKKALAGARFLQLQICYRPELLERFLRAAHDTGLTERLAMLPSICILRTVGGIRFVATKVPGVDVPAHIVKRVEQAKDAEQECEEIAYEQAMHALSQPGVAGLHFISFRKDAGIAKLCTRLKIPGGRDSIERESNGDSASVAV